MSKFLVLLCVFLIPAYIFRFLFFGLPTNILEVLIGLTLIVFLVERLLMGLRVKLEDDVRGPSASLRTTLRVGFWPAYLLVFFAGISVYFASDKTHALGIWKGWFFVPAVFYFLTINLFDKNTIRRITIPLFLSLLLVSIWAILQKLDVASVLFYQQSDPSFYDYLKQHRAFGPFESPNYLAMFIVPAGLLSLPILGYAQKKIDQILLLLMFIFPLFALYSSRSLGGLLAIGFAAISFLAFGLAKTYRLPLVRSGKKIALWTFGLIIAAVGFAFIFSSISSETYSRNIRVEIYNYAIELTRSHPVAGIGLGEFQTAVAGISSSNAGFQMYGLSYALHPHNLYLAFWLNLGIFGLLTFLFILFQFFVNLGKRGGDILLLSGAFAAMVAIMIHGIVDTTYFKNDLSAIFWLILAIGTICGNQKVASLEVK